MLAIDDDGEGDSHDGTAAHHVVEIDSSAGVEAPADHVEVVEDDDLEGVRAP